VRQPQCTGLSGAHRAIFDPAIPLPSPPVPQKTFAIGMRNPGRPQPCREGGLSDRNGPLLPMLSQGALPPRRREPFFHFSNPIDRGPCGGKRDRGGGGFFPVMGQRGPRHATRIFSFFGPGGAKLYVSPAGAVDSVGDRGNWLGKAADRRLLKSPPKSRQAVLGGAIWKGLVSRARARAVPGGTLALTARHSEDT